MSVLRLYLLAGLVTHKLVWEVLKRRDRGASQRRAAPSAAGTTLIKSAKVCLLAALVVQTLLPDILPILTAPAPLHVAGAVIYTIGLCMAVLARVQLGANWSDIVNPQILRQHRVVATGIYRYLRHPIYVGDLLLLLGLQLALNSWLVLGVGVLIPLVVQRAVREERMLSRAVPAYGAYCARTKRFVPYVV
jgi:protein-S-isoprenylcysteine O-methyltransferase Ste14